MPRNTTKGSKRTKAGQPRTGTANGKATRHTKTSNIGTPYDDVFKTMTIYISRVFSSRS